MSPRLLVTVLVLGCAISAISAWAGPALADDDNTVAADETFRAGEAAYARGDFEAAARSFEVSDKLAPHPNALYNAALAWDAAGKPERAADDFAGALSMDGLTEEQQRDAESRLAGLRPKLALLRIIAPPGTLVTLAHVERRVTPVAIYLVGGDYHLEAVYPDGESESIPVTATAGQEQDMDLAGRHTAPKPAKPPPRKPRVPPDTAPTGGNDAEWIAGWVAVGTGAVAGGIAIGLGVAALGARDDFDASGHTDRDAHDRADALRTATNVTWTAAGVCAATGALLLILSAVSDDDAEAAADAAIDVDIGTDGVLLHF